MSLVTPDRRSAMYFLQNPNSETRNPNRKRIACDFKIRTPKTESQVVCESPSHVILKSKSQDQNCLKHANRFQRKNIFQDF